MTNPQPVVDQKADTGPLPPLPPVAMRRRGQRSPWRWALAAGVLLVLGGLVASLTWPANPLADPRPVATVQGFAAAVEARDVTRMLELIEPTQFRRELSPELRSYIEYLTTASFVNASYTLLSSTGDVAQVRWAATLRYTLDLGSTQRSGEQTFDTTVELVKIEGAWYIRSPHLPETTNDQ